MEGNAAVHKEFPADNRSVFPSSKMKTESLMRSWDRCIIFLIFIDRFFKKVSLKLLFLSELYYISSSILDNFNVILNSTLHQISKDYRIDISRYQNFYKLTDLSSFQFKYSFSLEIWLEGN